MIRTQAYAIIIHNQKNSDYNFTERKIQQLLDGLVMNGEIESYEVDYDEELTANTDGNKE